MHIKHSLVAYFMGDSNVTIIGTEIGIGDPRSTLD